MRIHDNWNTHTAYPYNLTTGAATTPITLAEVKAFLKLDASDTSEDTFLTLLIEAAVDIAEKFTKRELINKTFTTYRKTWAEITEIRRSKLQSVTSIKYYDADDVLTTVSSSIYAHTDEVDYSRIYTAPEQNWPTSSISDRLLPIEIIFVAGYGASGSDVPASIRRALLEHVLVLYEDRGDCTDCSKKGLQIPANALTVYKQYRINDINGNPTEGSRLWL